eukprot:s3344_g3.t1
MKRRCALVGLRWPFLVLVLRGTCSTGVKSRTAISFSGSGKKLEAERFSAPRSCLHGFRVRFVSGRLEFPTLVGFWHVNVAALPAQLSPVSPWCADSRRHYHARS